MTALLSDSYILSPEKYDRTTAAAAMLSDSLGPSPRGVAPWSHDAIVELANMSSLGEDWDGDSSAAPQRQIIESAQAFILNFLSKYGVARPYITPTRIGGILFSWQDGPHDLEVDFATADVATFAYLNADSGDQKTGILCSDDRPPQDDRERFIAILLRHFAV